MAKRVKTTLMDFKGQGESQKGEENEEWGYKMGTKKKVFSKDGILRWEREMQKYWTWKEWLRKMFESSKWDQ